MKHAAIKSAAVQAVIGLGLCVAAHAVFVDPTQRRLDEGRERCRVLQKQVAAADAERDRLPKILDDLARVREETRTLEEGGRTARDPSLLFETIMGAAREAGVRVDQIQPVAFAPKADGLRPGVTYSMTVAGSYGALTTFVRSLEHDTGYTRVRSVQISPVHDAAMPTVSAVIQTEHFDADVSRQPAVEPGGGK